ncbi:striated muscle preferentially expressed protein kinase-like [Anopheles bellator]|uniref:striated muscle preferentially expressed protein kinase-like n=1 Tax=Anopheles bellator TaxID=139047 RepID=UPI0026474C40|nr:striated muscle preferentially expressed protein kinase-like [Anopheles bellator]
MDVLSLSLDDIIRQKKGGRSVTRMDNRRIKSTNVKPVHARNTGAAATVRKKAANAGRGVSRSGDTVENIAHTERKPKPVVDARLKIIQKNRAKIRDARDKLVEITRTAGDARLRLLRKGKDRVAGAPPASSNGMGKNGHSAGHLVARNFHDLTPPQGALDNYRVMNRSTGLEVMEVDEDGNHSRQMTVSSLKRTVRNDIFSLPSTMPPLPTFRSVRHSSPPSVAVPSSSWASDPFDCYELPSRRPNLTATPIPQPMHTQYEASDVSHPRSILRTRCSSPTIAKTAVDHQHPPHLSSTMRARLERAPNPSESMGIFSKMPDDQPHNLHQQKQPTVGGSPSVSYRFHSPPLPPTNGYRIVVSNLHSSVTQLDIKELFEDIGDLLESRLVRPGVAEVIYRTLKDAEKAVDAYHNRQLDGQPMNCLLVHPRSSVKLTAPAIKYGR